jgi:hypothetical protein
MSTHAHVIVKAILEDPHGVRKNRLLRGWLFNSGDNPLATVMGVLNVLCRQNIIGRQLTEAADAVQYSLNFTPLQAINVKRTIEGILSQPFSMTQIG